MAFHHPHHLYTIVEKGAKGSHSKNSAAKYVVCIHYRQHVRIAPKSSKNRGITGPKYHDHTNGSPTNHPTINQKLPKHHLKNHPRGTPNAQELPRNRGITLMKPTFTVNICNGNTENSQKNYPENSLTITTKIHKDPLERLWGITERGKTKINPQEPRGNDAGITSLSPPSPTKAKSGVRITPKFTKQCLTKNTILEQLFVDS